MLNEFHVVGIDFDTPEITDWRPQDPLNCDVWATVDVGDDRGGSFYQLHICTPQSIGTIRDKQHCFMIAEFLNLDDLVMQLNAFLEANIGTTQGDPFFLLSKYWHWEYDKLNRGP